MTAAITTTDLSYTYGNQPVLENLSFSVREGSLHVIIGPNGSGKTTLLKTIAGILKSPRGSIRIFDKPSHTYSRRNLARTVALVEQLAPVDFPFTALEVVLMGRSPHLGALGIEQKSDLRIAHQALAFTGVDHLAQRKLDQLSGGEQQRVFIARAICQEPKVMLLDEPTASLDLAHQVRVMDLMEKLRDEKGVTIVMVSHDVNLAAMYGDELLLLKEGCLVSTGPPESVLTFETLEEAYGCTLLVDESPLGKMPRVTLVPSRFLKRS